MIVCHSKKFIFFKPLKVAGSSIEAALVNICDKDDLIVQSSHKGEELLIPDRNNLDYSSGLLRFETHESPEIFFEKTKSVNWDEYTKIAVIRNPWDLCVSYWWWAISEYRPPRNRIPTLGDTPIEIKRKFSLFLPSHAYYLDARSQSEMKAQRVVDWLSRASCEFIHNKIDVFLRFENLNSDFNNLCDTLEIDNIELPKLKSSQRKLDYHYAEYYSDSMKSLVGNKFHKVIDKFNYKFYMK